MRLRKKGGVVWVLVGGIIGVGVRFEISAGAWAILEGERIGVCAVGIRRRRGGGDGETGSGGCSGIVGVGIREEGVGIQSRRGRRRRM